MATMQDVAKLAGVSPATVSYALRNDPRIVPETAERVRKAAKSLRYTTNLSARTLRSGKNGIIGVAIFELDRPYPSEMAAAVSREATKNGVQAIIQQTSSSKKSELSFLEQVTSQLCDGTIFSPAEISNEEILALSGGKPIVLLDDTTGGSLFDTVYTASEEGAQTAIEHLLSVGCTNIAVLGSAYPDPEVLKHPQSLGERRIASVIQTLEEHQLTLDPENALASSWGTAEARDTILQALKEGKKFDGLFCLTDSIALGALRGLHEYGVSVPEDVAVIGFDGISEGEFCTPSLSTVSTDMNDLAMKATSLLLQRINNPDDHRPPQKMTANFTLEVRESTTRK